MSFADNITLEELESDPYAVYARLRAESPVAFVPAVNSWLVSRWDDVNTVANTPSQFSAEDDNAPVVRHFGKPAIIHTDGDTHKTLRGGIAPYYMPRKVAAYIEPLVRPLALARLNSFRSRGQAELIADYFLACLCPVPCPYFRVERHFVTNADGLVSRAVHGGHQL